MMSTRSWLPGLALVALALAGCTHKGKAGVFAHRGNAPDEFAVGRAVPLTVPPDFALVPPRPGQPRPQEADSSTQALSALFGGSKPASAGESALLGAAGGSAMPGVRSDTGVNGTQVVDKGSATRDIVDAPASSSPTASAGTGAAAATGSAQASPANPSSGATPPPR